MNDTPSPAQVPPAAPAMAAKLAVNRTGRLTTAQRRLALIVGISALVFLLCPLAMLLQMGTILFVGGATPISSLGRAVFTLLGLGFLVLLAGLVGSNIYTFLGEGLMRRPVRCARGVLDIRVTEGHRPELPFSFMLGDYSFAPYVAPADLPMRAGAPYLVYYGARSRLLLSMAALDAPDAAQWEPEF